MSSDGPWYGGATIALTGVLFTQIVTIVQNSRRNWREDSRRWHADRRAIYAEFVATAYQIVELPRWTWRTPNEEIDSKIELMRDLLVLNMQKVQLSATLRVVEAAVVYRDGVLHLLGAHFNKNPDFPNYSEALASVSSLSGRFVRAARQELGMNPSWLGIMLARMRGRF